MQSKEIMDTGTKTVSLNIPGQQTSPAPLDGDSLSGKERFGHWLGFWYGWWLCWWAGFFIASVPVSFFFSFFGQKLSRTISTALRKLGSCPARLSCDFLACDYLMVKRNKEELSNSEETSRWRNLMPGIMLGVVIGIFQIINCMMRHNAIEVAFIGIFFGFVLLLPNAFIFKIVV